MAKHLSTKIKSVVRAVKDGGARHVKVEVDGEKIVVTEIATPTSEP